MTCKAAGSSPVTRRAGARRMSRAIMPTRFVWPVCLAALSLVVSPASAITPGIGAFGGFNTYSMQAWNDDLEVANADGSHFNKLNHGMTWGLGARAWLDEK